MGLTYKNWSRKSSVNSSTESIIAPEHIIKAKEISDKINNILPSLTDAIESKGYVLGNSLLKTRMAKNERLKWYESAISILKGTKNETIKSLLRRGYDSLSASQFDFDTKYYPMVGWLVFDTSTEWQMYIFNETVTLDLRGLASLFENKYRVHIKITESYATK